MQKPYKYTAVHKVTKENREFNEQPLTYNWEEWESISPETSVKVMKWDFYIDTRYDAKLRIYNYINGIKPYKYRPFEGTEIGKTIPILNF